jgi:hypothetical protein
MFRIEREIVNGGTEKKPPTYISNKFTLNCVELENLRFTSIGAEDYELQKKWQK